MDNTLKKCLLTGLLSLPIAAQADSGIGAGTLSRLDSTKSGEDPIAYIDACMSETMKEADIPGAALALVVDGELVYERGYGVKHRKQGDPVDAETLFRFASAQKMMTAAAVMTQVESGAVDLDEPVTNLIPELQFSGPWRAESITVGHLLTHTAAIPDFSPLDCGTTEYTVSEWSTDLGDISLYAPPGSFYNYSNPGYDLAGLVVERASGIPYHQFMHHWIWQPAGMMASTLLPEEVIAYANYAYGHWVNPKTKKTVFIAPDNHECWWSAPSGTNAFSTAGDLARWALLLMEGGGEVLAPSSVEAMQARQVSKNHRPGEDYGYGIHAQPQDMFAEPYQHMEIRGHGGDSLGSSSYLLWAPEEGFAAAVLANGGNSDVLKQAAYCTLGVVFEPQVQEEPNYITDPSTWEQYSGLYLVRDFHGFISGTKGNLIPVYVAMVDDQLFFWQLNEDSEIQRFPVQQLYLDTFFVDFDANGKFSHIKELITFIEGVAPSSEPALWLRNRLFVGERIASDISSTTGLPDLPFENEFLNEQIERLLSDPDLLPIWDSNQQTKPNS